MKNWLFNRAKEKSTWAGAIVLLGQLGYLSSVQVMAWQSLVEHWPAIVSTLGGLAAVALKEKAE